MIFEIALGIVLAVLILVFLPHLLALGLIALVGLGVLLLIGLAIANLEATIGIAILGIIGAAIFFGHKYGLHLLQRRYGDKRAEKYMGAVWMVVITLMIATSLIHSGLSYGWASAISSLMVMIALGVFFFVVYLTPAAASFLVGKARKIWSRRKNPEVPSLPKTDQN